MTKRELQAKGTKRKILRKAMELAREKGYGCISIREVCEGAGISTGAFYHHFRSKADIIAYGLQLFDEGLQKNRHRFSSEDPIENISGLVRYQMEQVAAHLSGLIKEMYLDSAETRLHRREVAGSAFRRLLEENIRLGLSQGRFSVELSAEEIAELIARSVNGMILDWSVRGYGRDLDSRYRLDFQLLMGALTGGGRLETAPVRLQTGDEGDLV